ncbi:MAG: IclR family transcriptional regulator [Pseudomonadota bacterium]|nr:IclR family transcriptional regulator [Desulfobacterales bacterium]MBL7101725.1 IclR family transcriptional regulator [Desulfobacteraceae bacterium]MBL7174123.1 IclR family transcriptional regulator [Desulfobacteraceae bacterium]MBU0736270.1 IclR family transcriptional regulator [Pseudomonadota bacterium]MBU0990782.1 IclR family transcriptional regulator [Pseudomonadota bacterium]
MATRYQAPSVKKAFQILKLISKANRGLGITELANSLEMSKGTVHGIISALEESGTIMRHPLTKKYTLGFTLFELGKLAYSQIDLKDLARPVMENLMERTQESVYVGVLNGEHITILDIAESSQDLKITSPRGTTIPLFAGATGKVILASMDKEKALDIIRSNGLPRFTERTITDPEVYIQEIERARETGYATDYEEYISGVRAVASAIKGWKPLISAIWVVGFKTSLDDHKMETLINVTREAAEEISRRIEEQSISHDLRKVSGWPNEPPR